MLSDNNGGRYGERQNDYCWCLSDGGAVKIERIVPMYPYSKDKAVYNRPLKIPSLYRITMGQARQEELLESF